MYLQGNIKGLYNKNTGTVLPQVSDPTPSPTGKRASKCRLCHSLILVNNQLDAQFSSVYVYFDTRHVSSNHVLIIRRINFINTTSGICHSM